VSFVVNDFALVIREQLVGSAVSPTTND